MGGRATKKKEVLKKEISAKSKASSIKKPLVQKKAELRSKVKETKIEVKVSKPKKAPKFTYDSLILDHRENGRKLARSILRKWRVHMPGEEVDSIVDLALCESAKRFCPKKGASFMTFFFYHLRGHLVRAVARATQSCAIINGPKTDEWCDEEHSEFASSYGAYLNNELHNQRENETPEQIMLRREKIMVTRDAIDKLDTLEKVVLDKSYGDDEALVDIAKNLGYSRCHISRVKKGALIRLKTVLEHSNAVNGTIIKKKEESLNSKKSIVVKLERKTRRKNKRTGKINIISSQAA
jgi:RNA polymerase sigma factor (sigma-70 family)